MILLYQLDFPTSQDCFGILLCGYATVRFSRCCSLKQRCMCAASLTFYAGKILSKQKSSGGLWRTVWKFLKKLIIDSPYDPAIPLLGIYLEKTIILKDTWTPVVIAIARHCNAIAKHCNSLNFHQQRKGYGRFGTYIQRIPLLSHGKD